MGFFIPIYGEKNTAEKESKHKRNNMKNIMLAQKCKQFCANRTRRKKKRKKKKKKE